MKIMLARDRNVLNTNWLIYFANLLAERGHEVLIACDTYSKLGALSPQFTLNQNVRVCNLSGKDENKVIDLYHKFRAKFVPPYFRFNKFIKKENPDVIISYFPNDLFNITRFQNHDIPIIQMIHGWPHLVLDKYLNKPNFIKKLYQKSFHKINTFHVLLPSFKEDIDSWFKPKNIEVIANPVEQIKDKDVANLSIEKKKIIYIARIERNVKQPHVLIEAFNKIAKDFPDWKVEIYGLRKYPEYDKEINDYIANNGLSLQVFMMGYTKDLPLTYGSADIHAFPSNCEGFSLAIADGMAYGLPHIGFKHAHSVNEVIIDGHNGFLASDIDDFADKLKTLMSDKELRIKMGQNARNDMKNYAPNVIIDKWEKLLNEVVKK